MMDNRELVTRIKAAAFMTSSVLQSIANCGTPDKDTLEHIAVTLEMDMLNTAMELGGDDYEKNSK